jgi:hypothetical protein
MCSINLIIINFFFVVLGLELRAFTLAQPPALFFVMGFL